MWWLIIGDVVAHCWRCGSSLLEILYGGSLSEMFWLKRDVGAHNWKCGGSFWRCGGSEKMLWLIIGDVVAHCWRCVDSLLEMWWLIRDM